MHLLGWVGGRYGCHGGSLVRITIWHREHIQEARCTRLHKNAVRIFAFDCNQKFTNFVTFTEHGDGKPRIMEFTNVAAYGPFSLRPPRCNPSKLYSVGASKSQSDNERGRRWALACGTPTHGP